MKRRTKWIDIAKGIAIFMVLIGHGMRDSMRLENSILDYIYRVCYVFHMSFFFFLSGFSLRNSLERYSYDRKLLMKKKVKSLFLPWISYTLLIYLLFHTALRITFIRSVLEDSGYNSISLLLYLKKAFQLSNDWAYHLWFLLVLFIISILFIVISKKSKFSLAIIAVTALFTVGHGYYDWMGSWNDLFFHLAVYIPYFLIGYKIQLERLVTGDTGRVFFLFFGGLGILYILVRARFFSGFNGNNIAGETKTIRVTVAYLGYILLPFVMVLLCRLSYIFSKSMKGIVKGLAWLGENSFHVYLWHQPFCCAFAGLILYDRLHFPAVFTILFCIALSLFAGFIATELRAYLASALRRQEGRLR